MRGLLRFGVLLAAGLAILAFPVALGMNALWGHDVWLVERQTDAAVVSLQKSQWKAEHPDGKGTPESVLGIYGSPLSRERVIVFAPDRLVKPSEDPSLIILPVAKAHDNPLQRKTLDFFAKWVAIGGGAVALLGLALLAVTKKRAPAA